MEIDHETISTAILLPSADSRRVVVSYKRKYVHKVLVNRSVKLAQEKSVVRWTDHPNMTIAVDWDVKNQNQTKTFIILTLEYHLSFLWYTLAHLSMKCSKENPLHIYSKTFVKWPLSKRPEIGFKD